MARLFSFGRQCYMISVLRSWQLFGREDWTQGALLHASCCEE